MTDLKKLIDREAAARDNLIGLQNVASKFNPNIVDLMKTPEYIQAAKEYKAAKAAVEKALNEASKELKTLKNMS